VITGAYLFFWTVTFQRSIMPPSTWPRLETSPLWKPQKPVSVCSLRTKYSVGRIKRLNLKLWAGIAQSVLWLGYEFYGRYSIPGQGIFSSPPHPDELWDPPSLLSNRYQGRIFPLGGGGVTRQGREFDHSPTSCAEFKNAWSYTSSPPYVFMSWYLDKRSGNFTLIAVR
jgi:hypothetical protein